MYWIYWRTQDADATKTPDSDWQSERTFVRCLPNYCHHYWHWDMQADANETPGSHLWAAARPIIAVHKVTHSSSAEEKLSPLRGHKSRYYCHWKILLLPFVKYFCCHLWNTSAAIVCCIKNCWHYKFFLIEMERFPSTVGSAPLVPSVCKTHRLWKYQGSGMKYIGECDLEGLNFPENTTKNQGVVFHEIPSLGTVFHPQLG